MPGQPSIADQPASAPSNLRTRLISAVIGIPIVLLAIVLDEPGIGTLIIIAALVAGYELGQMVSPRLAVNARYIIVVTAIAAGGVTAATSHSELAVSLLAFGAALGIAGLFSIASTTGNPYRTRLLVIGFAALFYGGTLAHAVPLVSEDHGRSWVLMAILGTFAADTGAYFTGRAIGRRKLAPSISPKKTWEGVFGGAIAAIGAVIAMDTLIDLPLAIWEAVLLGIAITCAAVAGDLFESWLKRKANVKDSGRIIPGHGGILDRIDSLAPNLAVVYWAVQLLEI